jgi:hypothetical protein
MARDRMAGKKNGFIVAWRDGGFVGCQGANMADWKDGSMAKRQKIKRQKGMDNISLKAASRQYDGMAKKMARVYSMSEMVYDMMPYVRSMTAWL